MDLSRRLRQQESIAAFGAFALDCHDESALLAEAVRIAASGTGGAMAKVLKFRPEPHDLLIIAGIGWKPDIIGSAAFRIDEESPVGFAFLNEKATLSNDLIAEERFRTPAILLEHGVRAAINVPLSYRGEIQGILEVDSQDSDCFTPADTAFLLAVSNMIGIATERQLMRDELEQIAELRKLQAEELRHRIKNLFTVVHSLIGLSERDGRKKGDPQGAFAILRGRIEAMARASNIGAGNLDMSESTVDVVDLTRSVLQAYDNQVTVTGDRTLVPSLWSTPLGLLFYELATNAAKYGALSEEAGQVVVTWSMTGNVLTGTWVETGGPAIEAPFAGTGFGSRMLDSVAAQVDGTLTRDWTDSGLTVSLVIPVEPIEAL